MPPIYQITREPVDATGAPVHVTFGDRPRLAEAASFTLRGASTALDWRATRDDAGYGVRLWYSGRDGLPDLVVRQCVRAAVATLEAAAFATILPDLVDAYEAALAGPDGAARDRARRDLGSALAAYTSRDPGAGVVRRGGVLYVPHRNAIGASEFHRIPAAGLRDF